MKNQDIVAYIKEDVAQISMQDFLSQNYHHILLEKVLAHFEFKTVAQLKEAVLEEAPLLFGYSTWDKSQLENKLKKLREQSGWMHSSSELYALNDSEVGRADFSIQEIRTALANYPAEKETDESWNQHRQIEFIFKMLFKLKLGNIPKNDFRTASAKERDARKGLYHFSEFAPEITHDFDDPSYEEALEKSLFLGWN